ncbi:MAG: zinc ribbon domain-containing protein [Dehalococcoidia bacterium]|nr:zinc ribbon domain-containing protein [Dehalococcoidia bacterium]
MVSERLKALLDDILAGRAPNAGRFCGHCYQPLSEGRELCPHCGRSTPACAPVAAVPLEVIEMHRRRRGREGLVVRSVAWGGLSAGVVIALLPLAFADVQLWTVLAFFGLLAFFYLLSANLANSVGDALGYRWGYSLFRKRWERFVGRRDG